MTTIQQNKQILYHILIWVLVFFAIAMLMISETGGIVMPLMYRIAFGVLIFYINYCLLVPTLLLKKKRVLYFLAVIALITISYILIPLLFNTVQRDPNAPRATGTIILTLINIVVGTVIRVYQQFVINDKKKIEIETQKQATELEILKNQLNPHFLFNSLNSIYSLTVKKSDDAPEAVIMLSELMRYMIYKADNEFVLLKDELEYIENYIALQRMRIAKNEDVTVSIKGNVTNQKIRPLLFISYIENAFKYGTDFNGNTKVNIDLTVNDNELQFTCVNLIGSRTVDEENSGIGMKNTNERLQLLYPKKHWLTVSEENNNFTVNLTLQLD